MKHYHFEINQIADIENCDYAFRSYEQAIKHGLFMSDYSKVYCGYVEGECEEDVLEKLFIKFNTDLPKDFIGHSLSVSDIILLDGILYYVDIIGFKEVKF